MFRLNCCSQTDRMDRMMMILGVQEGGVLWRSIANEMFMTGSPRFKLMYK